MKMNKLFKGFLVLNILIGCQKTIDKGELLTSIYFASDLHLYSNNLIGENNQTYIKENFTSDGRVQEYDYELIDSLINEVNKNKPNYLILTGDLSYNGEKDSMLELKKKLDTINNDTQVLVIPGNHDCYSINPFSCLEDKAKYLDAVTYDEFEKIFENYGYSNAYSYDQDSLSYIYELNDKHWILMLDTSLSEYNSYYNTNLVGGFIDESTYSWLESNLQFALNNNIEVISATHHNLMIHNELFASNYTLNNFEDILDLFSKYKVKLNFSGHLHIQSIKNKVVNDYEIYDISSGSLLDYGNRFGKLNIYEKYYEYDSQRITSIDDNINFDEYSFNNFYQEYYSKSINYNNYIYGKNGEVVTDLLSQINAYYFDGNYLKINELKRKNELLLTLIKEQTANYQSSNIKTIIEIENKNQHQLLIEK